MNEYQHIHIHTYANTHATHKMMDGKLQYPHFNITLIVMLCFSLFEIMLRVSYNAIYSFQQVCEGNIKFLFSSFYNEMDKIYREVNQLYIFSVSFPKAFDHQHDQI